MPAFCDRRLFEGIREETGCIEPVLHEQRMPGLGHDGRISVVPATRAVTVCSSWFSRHVSQASGLLKGEPGLMTFVRQPVPVPNAVLQGMAGIWSSRK
jgi:hypothetical protein